MESRRNGIEDVLIHEVVVLSQHVEHGFFVAQQAVERQVIVDQPLLQLLERYLCDAFDIA